MVVTPHKGQFPSSFTQENNPRGLQAGILGKSKEVPISVILPVYNDWKNVSAAVRSCLRSLSPQDELIIINDGSVDNTAKVLSRIRDQRIRVIKNEKNLGLARSLNIGIREARNDYIARMDSDDYCLPWRFSIQRNLAQDKDADFIFGTQIFRAGVLLTPMLHTFVTRTNETGILTALPLACILAHPTMLAKKTTLEELGSYPEVFAEDYALWLIAAMAQKTFVRHWLPVNIYKISRDSLSRQKRLESNPLKHLESLRLNLAAQSLGSHEVTSHNIRAIRRKLLLRDPLLFLETGIFRIRGIDSDR